MVLEQHLHHTLGKVGSSKGWGTPSGVKGGTGNAREPEGGSIVPRNIIESEAGYLSSHTTCEIP